MNITIGLENDLVQLEDKTYMSSMGGSYGIHMMAIQRNVNIGLGNHLAPFKEIPSPEAMLTSYEWVIKICWKFHSQKHAWISPGVAIAL